MESLEIDDSFKLLNEIKETQKGYDINNDNEHQFKHTSSLLQENKRCCSIQKLLKIPFILFILILTSLAFLMVLITFVVYIFKYEETYDYEENAYAKPKYAFHEYSTITFDNGLKIVLCQVHPDDRAGGVISFDYGYLDTNFKPGYLKLAFLSLINEDISNSNILTQYFGTFNYLIEKYYSSFDFSILGGGFQSYLKSFSALTYLKDNDARLNFEHIGNKSFNTINNLSQRKSHILEYLIYGYQDSEGRDIIPSNSSQIISDLNGDYIPIINIMKKILSNPSKIKIILYSHYKPSLMKKYFLKYFNDIINRPKISNNNIYQITGYNLYNFTTDKIIYMNIFGSEQNFIEINYYISKDDETTYNQLIKDSQYFAFITYILNQTNEGSLYYELNHDKNNITIKSLSSGYEIVSKNKIKFSILVELNHFSYNFIEEIILKVYNYMNNIKLYINDYNDINNDIRIEELENISEQNFTFIEDAHDNNFYIYISFELFYRDEKNFLLKQMWFSKKNFIENINKVKYYYNQLTMNNSVLILGISNRKRTKYNLQNSTISYIFQKTERTRYFPFIYSEYNLIEHFKENYDNNYTFLLNYSKNEYISKYNSNCHLEYDSKDEENYFKTTFEEKNDKDDFYTKVFWKKDTSLHTPKIFSKIFFFHPFFRPNKRNESKIDDIYNITENHKFVFKYLLYFAYIKRTIQEKLADAFRAGGNYFYIYFNENFFFLDLFLFSDIAQKVLKVIKDIIYDTNDFKYELENRFEIYKDLALEDLLNSNYYTDYMRLRYSFFGAITNDKNKKNEKEYKNLPPIYDITKFPYDNFVEINYDEINNENDISNDIYAIKYIFLFGYYNESDAYEIYKIFNTTNNFQIPLDIAGFNLSEINDKNFVDWTLKKPIINTDQKIYCDFSAKYTNRLTFFTTFDSKSSCLSNMLVDILSHEKNMIQNNISVYTVNQKYIYLRYMFKNRIIENLDFRNKLIKWLENFKDMENQVDVIGDRFYYLLKGYKTQTALKHNNMYESAFASIYGKLYDNFGNNSALNFTMEKYEDFIDYIKGYFDSNKYYVEIEPYNP